MSIAKKSSEKSAKKAPKPELPVVHFPDQSSWAKWLATHHGTSGVWMKLAKKSTGLPSITYKEALDVALVWGWIDGQSRGLDETWWIQRYTPRGARSLWSKVNREHVARLIAEGKMMPRGFDEIARAKADGRWDAAYDPPSRATIPEDLAAAFALAPEAAKLYAALDSTNRYAIIHRLQTTKQAETRARKVKQFVEMLSRGETLHPRKGVAPLKKPKDRERPTGAKKPQGKESPKKVAASKKAAASNNAGASKRPASKAKKAAASKKPASKAKKATASKKPASKRN